MKKKLLIIGFIIICISLIFNIAYCSQGLPSADGLSGMYDNPDPTVQSMGGRILWVVDIICYGLALIILIIKGAKFIMASPEGKAEIKQETINYAIGAFILFGIATILTIIINVTKNVLG